jgi:hypothetical protein
MGADLGGGIRPHQAAGANAGGVQAAGAIAGGTLGQGPGSAAAKCCLAQRLVPTASRLQGPGPSARFWLG